MWMDKLCAAQHISHHRPAWTFMQCTWHEYIVPFSLECTSVITKNVFHMHLIHFRCIQSHDVSQLAEVKLFCLSEMNNYGIKMFTWYMGVLEMSYAILHSGRSYDVFRVVPEGSYNLSSCQYWHLNKFLFGRLGYIYISTHHSTWLFIVHFLYKTMAFITVVRQHSSWFKMSWFFCLLFQDCLGRHSSG